jgi:hypothetical protein
MPSFTLTRSLPRDSRSIYGLSSSAPQIFINALEVICNHGIICSPIISSTKPLWHDSAPFGLSVSTQFRLFKMTTLTMVRITLFIAFLSLQLVRAGFSDFTTLSCELTAQTLPSARSAVGLPRLVGVAIMAIRDAASCQQSWFFTLFVLHLIS